MANFLHNKKGKVIISIIILISIILILSIYFVSAPAEIGDIGKDKEKPNSEIYKRTATTDTYKNSDGTYTKILYSGTINRDDKTKNYLNYVPFEDTINITATKSGEFKIEDYVTGKECFIEMEYNKISPNVVQPVINITKSRGFWYFTTDSKTEVNSMAYKLNCNDFDLKFEDDSLKIGEEMKIDFKQARNKQNITTVYNPKDKKLEFSIENGKTGKLDMIDPIVTLQDADTENLKDSYVNNCSQGNNYGNDDELKVGTGSGFCNAGFYITFNLTSLYSLEIYEITSARLTQYRGGYTSNPQASVHHVYNDWKRGNGAGYSTETQLTWANQPCGANFSNSTNCNLTAEDSGYIIADPKSFNVTNMLKRDYGSNNNSLTIYERDNGDGIDDRQQVWSKEYAVTSERPSLSITYTLYIIVDQPTPSQTFTDYSSVQFNISTAGDMTLCYWSNNSGAINYSMGSINTTYFSNTTSGSFLGNGNYNVVFYCNQSEDGTWRTSDSVSFTINVNTYTNLTLPKNNSWSNSLTNNFVCNSSTSGGNLNNVTLYIWNSTSTINNTVNKSISGTFNSSTLTAILPRDDSYIWNCYSCDDYSNCAFAISNYTLNVDATYPLISIIIPTNNTNTLNTQLNINYTRSDDNLGSCWYTRNVGKTNTTLANCINISGVTWYEGKNNITIYVNDSVNNVNSSSVTFILDTTPPSLIITEPQNATNYANNNSIELNFSVSDITTSVSTCWYNVYLLTPYLVAISNTTIANCQNTTFGLQAGDYNHLLNFYVNDSLNNINTTEIYFGIRTTSPAISLKYPTNNQYLNNQTNYFNFTATDSDGLNTCELWGNWTGTWHKNYTWVSPVSSVMNYTQVSITDGKYFYNIWCNDTLNNYDFSPSNYTFTIDTINPNVNITTINETSVSGFSLTINFDITDTNPNICYFTVRNSSGGLHNYAENTSVSCSLTSRIISTTEYGTFTFQLWAEDKAGNLNSDIITFITTEPSLPPSGGGGGGSQIIILNKTSCGDGICQYWGNDVGLNESWYNCYVDCGQNATIKNVLCNPFSKNQTIQAQCLWAQGSPLQFIFYIIAGVFAFFLLFKIETKPVKVQIRPYQWVKKRRKRKKFKYPKRYI